MSKLLVIFGITGQQGSSVANFVLSDPELSKQYHIRGVTRNKDSATAQTLANKGVDLVRGDFDDHASIAAALNGAHTIFAMTNSIFAPDGKDREIQQGKLLADTAVAAGASYFIWSTAYQTTRMSDLKYSVDIFDSKAAVETYLRSLPIKSAFVNPGTFMQNLRNMSAPRPSPAGDGTFVIAHIIHKDTKMPWVDIVGDTGKFVGAVLAAPEQFEGKLLNAAGELRSYGEIAELLSKKTGKTVSYKRLEVEEFRKALPPPVANMVVNMFLFNEEFGYYGPEMKQEVAWSLEQARGKVVTLEEYLNKEPLTLG